MCVRVCSTRKPLNRQSHPDSSGPKTFSPKEESTRPIRTNLSQIVLRVFVCVCDTICSIRKTASATMHWLHTAKRQKGNKDEHNRMGHEHERKKKQIEIGVFFVPFRPNEISTATSIIRCSDFVRVMQKEFSGKRTEHTISTRDHPLPFPLLPSAATESLHPSHPIR